MPIIKDVRARFHRGNLVPLQPLEIKEGEVVIIRVEVETPEERAARVKRARETLKRTAGGWKGQHDDHNELIREIYQARLDGSRQKSQNSRVGCAIS